VQCFQCDQEAQQECPRCGALYCDAHGDALCARCMDPTLALPSYRVYRGSLAALLIGSVFAIILLVLPPASADRDAPPTSLAGVLPTRVPATPTLAATAGSASTPGPAATGTPGPAATSRPATATPTATPASIRYTVRPGDTLYGIAERHLPPGRDLDQFKDQIQQFNRIADASALQAGQVIQIPR